MDPRVELQPDKTLIILGPHFAASLVEGDEEEKEVSTLSPLTYVELAEILSSSRATKQHATDKVLCEWLENNLQNSAKSRCSALLARLVDLQGEGALIAYSYVDETVSNAAQQVAIQPNQTKDWASGRAKGILHLFGICSAPESVRLSIAEESAHYLKLLLHERACVLLGFDGGRDPFMDVFLQLCTSAGASTPLCVTKESWTLSPSLSALPLPVPDPSAPEILCEIGDLTKSVGKQRCTLSAECIVWQQFVYIVGRLEFAVIVIRIA